MIDVMTRVFDRRGDARGVEVVADDEGVRVVVGGGLGRLRFRWRDVAEIRTFKVDLGTTDDVRLAFRARGVWHEFSEDWEGFMQLTQKMAEVFPTVAEDWYAVVMFPPFAANETVLYLRG